MKQEKENFVTKMVYCSVVGCKSGGPKSAKVRTHNLPTSKAMRAKWLNQLNRDFKPTKYTVVCSKHFCATDYILYGVNGQKLSQKKLRPEAYPTKYLKPPAEEVQSKRTKRKSVLHYLL